MLNNQSILAQLTLDKALYDRLKELGDDPRKLHTIDHRFFASRDVGLRTMEPIIIALGFTSCGLKSVNLPDGTVQFWLKIQEEYFTNLKLAARISVMMLALAEAYECTYDGWATQVVPMKATTEEPPAEPATRP